LEEGYALAVAETDTGKEIGTAGNKFTPQTL
jgi:hypothetical protein